MPRPDQSPSIVPQANQDTYLVLDDFGGRLGRAWREIDEEDTDRETLIRNLMDGQYGHPARIVAFNTAEGWSRDVTMISPTSYAGALRSTTKCQPRCRSSWRPLSGRAEALATLRRDPLVPHHRKRAAEPKNNNRADGAKAPMKKTGARRLSGD